MVYAYEEAGRSGVFKYNEKVSALGACYKGLIHENNGTCTGFDKIDLKFKPSYNCSCTERGCYVPELDAAVDVCKDSHIVSILFQSSSAFKNNVGFFGLILTLVISYMTIM
ncbi:unnamed protein product [Cunninghamella echinulata]